MKTIQVTTVFSFDQAEIGQVIDMPVVKDSELSAEEIKAWYRDKDATPKPLEGYWLNQNYITDEPY